jgi:pilus assembly protein CpaF
MLLSLRLKPDRIVIGEIRGEEAFEFLQALNTGHRGTISTTHANSARESLERFATCVLLADIHLGQETIARQIALGLNILVHLDVAKGTRRVNEVVRVLGYDSDARCYRTETIYAA